MLSMVLSDLALTLVASPRSSIPSSASSAPRLRSLIPRRSDGITYEVNWLFGPICNYKPGSVRIRAQSTRTPSLRGNAPLLRWFDSDGPAGHPHASRLAAGNRFTPRSLNAISRWSWPRLTRPLLYRGRASRLPGARSNRACSGGDLRPLWGGAGMSDAYDRAGGHRRVRDDIRRPESGVFALVERALTREALGHHGRLECGRSSLGEGRVKLWLPATTSRMGGRAAGATCPV